MVGLELAPPEQPLTDGVVVLRAWRSNDVDAVVEALREPEIPRWTGLPSPYGPSEFNAWMDQQAEQRAAGRGLHYAVVDSQDRLLGAVGVQRTEEAPDIGYWCVREHRGRGYVSRAVRLLRDDLRSHGFSRIDIFTHPDNEAAQHVAEAAGFRRAPGSATIRRLGAASGLVRFTF